MGAHGEDVWFAVLFVVRRDLPDSLIIYWYLLIGFSYDIVLIDHALDVILVCDFEAGDALNRHLDVGCDAKGANTRDLASWRQRM